MADVANLQIVSVRENEILVLAPRQRMTKQEALVHAAWLVALADSSVEFVEFRSILREVLNT